MEPDADVAAGDEAAAAAAAAAAKPEPQKEPPVYEPRRKSLLVAYALWAVGGLLGLHHLYLGRDVHAVLWALSGGGFGVGALADLFRMPAYVREAACDPEARERLRLQMRFAKDPPRGVLRTLSQLAFAGWFALVLPLAAGAEGAVDARVLAALAAVGTALGVYWAGVASGETCSPWGWTALGAAAGHAAAQAAREQAEAAGLAWYGEGDEQPRLATELDNAGYYGALFAFSYFRRWRTAGRPAPWRSPPRGGLRRTARYLAAVGLALMVAGSAAVHHVSIEVDGEQGTLRDHMGAAFSSPVWKQARAELGQLWDEFRREGVAESWSRARAAMFDRDGLGQARATLGVDEGASEADVRHAYRRLAREWHPDKNRERLEEAERRMAEINRAHEALQRQFRSGAIREEVRAEKAARDRERARAPPRRRERRRFQREGGWHEDF